MTLLYRRDILLKFGDIEISSRNEKNEFDHSNLLRIVFETNLHTGFTSNSCDIKIYNLSKDRRAKIQQGFVENKRVLLEAGYIGNRILLFDGFAQYINHIREEVDWVTSVRCLDARARSNSSVVDFEFKPGSTPIQVLEEYAKHIKHIKMDNAIRKFRDRGPLNKGFQGFVNGASFSGLPVNEMYNFLLSSGWEATLQNDELILVEPQGTTGSVFIMNENTGLIGAPETGISSGRGRSPSMLLRVKSLLNGRLRCTGRIKLETELINGEFRIVRSSHRGDTHGNEWESDMDVELLPGA